MRHLIDRVIDWQGDTWLVGNVGVVQDGKIYCHLWSKTRTLCTQRNGRKVPVQSCDWVPLALFGDAPEPISRDNGMALWKRPGQAVRIKRY